MRSRLNSQVVPNPEIITLDTPGPDIEIIDRSGDVVLVVGDPDLGPITHLPVSSAVLSSKSEVFKAMFSSRWLGSQEVHSSAQPKEVSLPDDEWSIMSPMCMLLHGFPRYTISSPRMLNLAIAANKYFCLDALQWQAQTLLLTQLVDEDVSPGMLRDMMLASYYFENPVSFEQASIRLLRDHSGDYRWMGDQWDRSMEDTEVSWLQLLTKQRAAAQKKISEGLIAWCSIEDGDGDDSYNDEAVTAVCGVLGISPFPQELSSGKLSMTVNQMIGALDTLQSLRCIASEYSDLVPHKGTTKTILDEDSLVELEDEVKRLCSGVCLNCVMAEEVKTVWDCDDEYHRTY